MKNLKASIVIRIARVNESVLPENNKICLEQYLSLRTIYPDGNVVSVDNPLEIPDFNFCILQMNGMKSTIEIYPIRNNFLLVTYTTNTNVPPDPFSYYEWGMIVDLNGNSYGKILFGPAVVDHVTNEWSPEEAAIEVNFNPDRGFIRLSPITNTSDFIWQQYSVDKYGEIQLLAEDIVQFPRFLSTVTIAIPMVDERYAIVYANSTDSGATLENPFKTQGGIYAIILEYGKVTEREPVVLYQTQIQGINFNKIDCDINYVGYGQTCIVTGIFTGRAIKDRFYLKIDFLSSGTVYSVTPLREENSTITQYSVQALPYGGYLLKGFEKVNKQIQITGYIFNDNVELFNWSLPNPTASYLRAPSEILRNNTFVLAQSVQVEDKRSWALITTDLHKFEEEKDHGYNNFHIDSTFPENNVMIKIGELNNLTITYYKGVDLSGGHILIFQDDGSIRQNTSGIDNRYVSLSEDGTTVFVKIINCIFSQPGKNYYVSIGNNFVKSRIYQEPLYGIKERVWSFKPYVAKEEKISDTVKGQVRLTANGTVYFNSLNESEQKNFFTKLRQELADAIPVSHERVTTNEKTQIDSSTSPKQIFLSIDINKDKTKQERTVSYAIKALDNLIRNKTITVIEYGEYSRYLDENYGYQTPCIILPLLVLLYIFARCKNPEAKNMGIFKVAIFIFDIVMGIFFITTKAKDVDKLYIPSLVFFIGPFIISVIIAFIIIKKEEENKKFLEWSKDNNKVVEIFTILAGTDVEALTELESKIWNFDFFKAEFSKIALRRMFWGSCFNIFFEDIPQLVIQIIYFRSVVNYDAIPLLTLLSSCLCLLSNIIGRLYRFKDHGRITYGGSDNFMDEKSNEKTNDIDMLFEDKEK
ncbi:3633_t:CDS:10 [Funneliformis mosseae]|uniref:3633_t:CDS:1 n=1 Tax=Funneliformis mosseae TaxID=27381 RepID=A0A9N8YWV8_FUNMO|nr:3633_t:CDS:10 [Funneliformis mosseae]